MVYLLKGMVRGVTGSGAIANDSFARRLQLLHSGWSSVHYVGQIYLSFDEIPIEDVSAPVRYHQNNMRR